MLPAKRDHGDELMPFEFDQQKAIQAVAFLLKTRPDATDNYMRLLKILYIADRESIKETGVPITGDAFVAMQHGTMLSRLLNLAKRDSGYLDTPEDHQVWDQYITRKPRSHDIQMIQDPGRGALCDYEINKLIEVATRYERYNYWHMRGETHKLPEYKNPLREGKRQKWIPLRVFLGAIRMGSIADEIEGEARANTSLRRLLGS